MGGHRRSVSPQIFRWSTVPLIVVVLLSTACSSLADYSEEAATAQLSYDAEQRTGNDDSSEQADDAPPTSTEADEGPADSSKPVTTTEPSTSETSTTDVPQIGNATLVIPRVVNSFPHDTTAFTQGLEMNDGVLVESLGLYGESGRRRVVPSTGEVSTSVSLPPELFGAGITVVDDLLIQLTWQAGIAILADPTTLQELDRRSYEGQGWGLCHLGDGVLAMTDGSDQLIFRNADTFETTGSVQVTLDGEPLDQLNELECVNGRVWANVWLSNEIVQIDPDTGVVMQRVDASSLVPGDVAPDDVLNGIAFNPDSDTFFITGKRWSVLYEVDLGPTS